MQLNEEQIEALNPARAETHSPQCDEASEHLRETAEHDPENTLALYELATLCAKGDGSMRRRPEEAEPRLKSLIDSGPNSADALLACALGIRHRTSASDHIRTREKAVELEPSHPGAQLALANEYSGAWRSPSKTGGSREPPE
jgi:hypothetical protein